MWHTERKIAILAKTTLFVLFIMLLGSYFDKDTVIILLLSLIYVKMRN
jgi:hypothetical protein